MVVVVQNDSDVPPGRYGDYLDGTGVPWRLVKCFEGELVPQVEAVRASIILGGAMGVHDGDRFPFLRDLQRLIRDCVAREVPLLGICLGGQLMAAALGGEVTANRWGEKGTLFVQMTTEGRLDPLFAGISDPFITFQWHHDSFDIPSGGVVLASSPACPHQAFRIGGNAYALQFHPEVTTDILETWSRGTFETRELVAAFSAAEAAYSLASARMLANFLALAGIA